MQYSYHNAPSKHVKFNRSNYPSREIENIHYAIGPNMTNGIEEIKE